MADVEELALQVRELADLQITLAGKLKEIEKSLRVLEQRTPVQNTDVEDVRGQLNQLREEASHLGEAMEAVSSLDKRVRTLEGSRGTERTGAELREFSDSLVHKLNEFESQINEIRAHVSTSGQEDFATIQNILKNQKAELDGLATAVEDLAKHSHDEKLDKNIKKIVEGKTGDVERETKKRLEEVIIAFEHDAVASRQRSEALVAEQVRQFQGLYGNIQRKLEASVNDIRKQTQTDLENFKNSSFSVREQTDTEITESIKRFENQYTGLQKRTEDTTSLLQKEIQMLVADTESTLNSIKQRNDQEFTTALKRLQDQQENAQKKLDENIRNIHEQLARSLDEYTEATEAMSADAGKEVAQKLRKYDEMFAAAERKVYDTTQSIENRAMSELKKESEKLRTAVLENIIELRDKVKHVETLEENLEGKVDAKLNEVSKTFSDLFQRSAAMLKEEIYEELTTELAESKASMGQMQKTLDNQNMHLENLSAELEEARAELADLTTRKRNEESQLMRDLEELEKRLKV